MGIGDFFDYPGTADSGRTATAAQTLGADWSSERWSRLREHTDVLHVHRGEHLIRRSEPQHALLLVEEGRLDVVKPTRGRRLVVVATVGPGAILGEQSFFDGMPHTADVVAVTDCQVRRLSTVGVERLSARHPEIARALLMELGRILSVRLRAAESLAEA
ncbi:MAG TPA: cyclic nucleotide-binding domain-containing protein [Euzebya sp.]|nr:cyclic nucleotide-binding domain-containing protein [Euzebya sp.]